MKRLLLGTAFLVPLAALADESRAIPIPSSQGSNVAAEPAINLAKAATITLSVPDWQAVLSSVRDSDRISAHDAGRISQSIVGQIQAQLSASNATKPQTMR